jgi:SpoVK/Ycf46/Vps4 family AAA+-type ATPase
MPNPLLSYIQNDDLTGLGRALAQSTASLDELSTEGMSLLMECAARGAEPMAILLLDHGADATLKSTSGKTAAEFARTSGHTRLSSRLQMAALLRNKQRAEDDSLLRELLGSHIFDAANKKGISLDPTSKAKASPTAPQSKTGQLEVTESSELKTPPAEEIRLEDLIGQQSAKAALNQIIAMAKLNQERVSRGLKPLAVTLHSVFSGSPGTGKTTFARFFAQEIRKLGVLKKGHLVEVARPDLVAEYMGQTANKTAAICEKAKGGILFIDEAYALKQGKDDSYGQEAIDTLLKIVEDSRGEMVLILAGYTDEMREFLDLNPGLRSRVPNQIVFEDFTSDELAAVLDQQVTKGGFTLDADARALGLSEIAKRRKGKYFGNARDVRNVFERAMAQQAVRLSSTDLKALSQEELLRLKYSDFTETPHDNSSTEDQMATVGKVVSAMHELESLTGLTSLKNEIKNLSGLIRVTKARTGGSAVQAMTLHMAFLGNPGTGKSTVARLLGKIFSELDLVSSGHIVEADRSRLVGSYIGQTAIKTREAVESALGGVLFIDEAYTLSRGSASGQNDSYGQEAIDTLVKCLEDYRSQFVCILAGYTSEMQEFLSANPGLRSRFPHILTFPDYSGEELFKIAEKFAHESGYVIADDAREPMLKRFVDEKIKPEVFGNARTVRNMVEAAFKSQAMRLIKLGDVESHSPEQLKTLVADDFVI